MEIGIITAQRAVTAAGTPEKLKEAPEWQDNLVIAVLIRANEDNTGLIYITDAYRVADITTQGYALSPGETLELDASQFQEYTIDLAHYYIDAAVSGDGIRYVAVMELGF